MTYRIPSSIEPNNGPYNLPSTGSPGLYSSVPVYPNYNNWPQQQQTNQQQLDMMQVYQEKMMAILSDPRKKTIFVKLLKDSQAGKLTPVQLATQLDALVVQNANTSTKSIILAFTLASILGVGFGQMVRSSLTQFERLAPDQTHWLESTLKFVDNIPGASYLNRFIERQLEKRRSATQNSASDKLSRLLKLDGFYDTEQLKREMVQRYLGSNGVYKADMQAMEGRLKDLVAPQKLNEVLKRIQNSSRHSELMQILKPEAIYYVPASIREYVRKFTNSKNGHTASLDELDQIISKNEFIKNFGKSTLGREILQDKNNLLGQLIRNSNSHEFAQVYEKSIISNPGYSKLLQKALDKPLPKTYPELRKSLGLKPYWDHIYDNLKGLLYKGDEQVTAFFNPKSTLASIDDKISRYHIVKHLDKLTPWRNFMETIKGFTKRFENFEAWHIPVIESSQTFINQMKSKQIKPLGRLAGLLWFNFSRMFEGNHYRRWRLASTLNKRISGLLFRVFVAAAIFGVSVVSIRKSNPESKRARFFDSIATGIGGFYGWELGKNVLPQLEPVKNNTLARLLSRRILKWPARITLGDFTSYFFLPFFVISWLMGSLAQKPSHLIFGDPDKIDQKLAKTKTDKPTSPPIANIYGIPQLLQQNQPSTIHQTPLIPTYTANYYPAGYQAWPSYNAYNTYYSPWQQSSPATQVPALATIPKEKQPSKSNIEPVSIIKASQKIPKITYTLDTKESSERLAWNPLLEDANREERRFIKRLKSIGI